MPSSLAVRATFQSPVQHRTEKSCEPAGWKARLESLPYVGDRVLLNVQRCFHFANHHTDKWVTAFGL